MSNNDNKNFCLLSYNIRVDHEQDANCENKWIHRRQNAIYMITKYSPDIITIQEPNEIQVSDIKSELGENYDWVHFRASERAYMEPDNFPSEQHRETQTIGYNKSQFTCLKSGRFWLAEDCNEEPKQPAWDGSIFSRVAVYALLQEKLTGQTITIITAHFDHVGLNARINSAHLIVEKAKALSHGGPFIITGDFNTFQNDRGIEVYQAFLKHSEITDVRNATTNIFGPKSTWVGWDYNAFNERKMSEKCPGEPSRWDHIFVSKINISRTEVDDTQFTIEWNNKQKEYMLQIIDQSSQISTSKTLS